MIELTLLGPPEVRIEGTDPPKELLWKKNLALLVYLAQSPHGRRSRDHLIGLFWGDRPEEKARHSLNEALRVLRRAGGDGLIQSTADQVTLDPALLTVDIQAFDTAQAAGDLARAAALTRGPFLEGFAVPGCSDFEDWVAGERFQINVRLVEALLGRAEELVDAGELAQARALADRATRVSPMSEEALRLALLVRALGGDRAEAVALYEDFATRLLQDLEMEPDDETVELAERIRKERDWQLPASVPPSERAPRRTELVGRADPLGRVLAELRAGFAANAPRLVVLEGEPGMGKSRLAAEIMARCRMDGVQTAQLRAVPGDRAAEGATAQGLLRSLAGPSPNGSHHPIAAGAGADFAMAELQTAFNSALGAATDGGPVLLVIDDAGFVDATSWTVVQRALRDLPSSPLAFLLCVARMSGGDVALDELRAQMGRSVVGCSITLSPLDPAQVEELAGSLLPDLDSDERARLARRVFIDSAGVPLLALELLNAVRLGLELGRVQPGWPEPFRTLVQTFPGDLPDSVVAAIRVGYRRLSEPAQELLAAASVLGDRVSGSTLGHVCSLADSDLHSSLDELEWQRWLDADSRGYTFVARIVRDVIGRDMLTAGQRQRILAAAGPDVGTAS